MNLAQAIKDLRDDIVGEGYDEDIMKDIAKDNGVAPQLLVRKFEEQFGVAPADYVAPKGIDEEKMIEAAKRAAKEYADANLQQVGSVKHGTVFERPAHPGRKYVTIGWFGNYLLCIRVDTNEVRRITFKNQASAINFIHKQGIV